MTVTDGSKISKTVKPVKTTEAEGYAIHEMKLNFITSDSVTVGARAQMAAKTARLLQETTSADAEVIGSASVGCIKQSAG